LKQPVSRLFFDSLESITAWEFDENKHDPPKEEDIENDWQFVVSYLLPTEGSGSICDVPNLIKQAKLVRDRRDKMLYTKESCLEFHGMLLDIIKDFMKSLVALHLTKRVPKSPSTLDFKRKVARTMVCGYVLQRLAKGAALKMHLKNLGPLLRYRPKTTISTQEEPEERDEDFETIHESVKRGDSLATSYLDWFRLLIAHFDAVDILVGYVTGVHF